jgi:hypothetical protein
LFVTCFEGNFNAIAAAAAAEVEAAAAAATGGGRLLLLLNTEENCEMIWKIWMKCEMIWKIWKKIVKRYGNYGRKASRILEEGGYCCCWRRTLWV